MIKTYDEAAQHEPHTTRRDGESRDDDEMRCFQAPNMAITIPRKLLLPYPLALLSSKAWLIGGVNTCTSQYRRCKMSEVRVSRFHLKFSTFLPMTWNLSMRVDLCGFLYIGGLI